MIVLLTEHDFYYAIIIYLVLKWNVCSFSVYFLYCSDSVVRRPGQSLPDLRLPLEADSGEDSTDSLIEESEEFLRRSIDSMITGSDYTHSNRRRSRRYSESHTFKGNVRVCNQEEIMPFHLYF